jgi:hypothetical protein
MSSINFRHLVESLLSENLAADLTPVIRGGVDVFPLEKLVDIADKYIFEKGKYERNGTILGFKVAWPEIDTIGFILKTLVDSKTITPDEKGKAQFLSAIRESDVVDGDTLLGRFTVPDAVNKKAVADAIDARLNYLKTRRDNYTDYVITRFRQLNDKTQMLAAEKYLTLSPHAGIVNISKEYGGYDLGLVENIINYPGETKFTQKSNIEGIVMATIVEISKLMLVFYREYIIEQKEVDAVIDALKLKDVNELRNVLVKSAGKLTANSQAEKWIQKDYINFTRGKSVFAIDPDVKPPIPDPTVTPPEPLIKIIADFQGLTGTGQLIYQAFLDLFNNIKRGNAPSMWKVAGKRVDYLTQTLGAIAGFAGASLYTGR